MIHYETMTIGAIVDKSNARNSSRQRRLAPTPYYKASDSFELKQEKRKLMSIFWNRFFPQTTP